MPPKQAAEDPASTYKPIFVLPIILDALQAQDCLMKPVNIKKNIDNAKII